MVVEDGAPQGAPLILSSRALIVIVSKELHPIKALDPMVSTDDGITMLVSDEQLLNALLPIDVSDSGKTISDKERQLVNALLSMLITPSGIVTVSKFVQAPNALLPRDVTPSGIVTFFILVASLNSAGVLMTLALLSVTGAISSASTQAASIVPESLFLFPARIFVLGSRLSLFKYFSTLSTTAFSLSRIRIARTRSTLRMILSLSFVRNSCSAAIRMIETLRQHAFSLVRQLRSMRCITD